MVTKYNNNNFVFFSIFAQDMRLFKRRCSDPSPQLVSLSPLTQEDVDGSDEKPRQTRSGQTSPARTPLSGSPKPHRKGIINI